MIVQWCLKYAIYIYFFLQGYFVEQDESEFEKQISLNYLGVVYITKALLPMMMKHATKDKHKHICFVGSACSYVADTGMWSASDLI